MAVYSPEFLAAARHGYENTDQPMRELARELGIGITTLSTLAEKHGWAKRSQRKRGLPPALAVLEEARALAHSVHSRDPSTLAMRASPGLASAEAQSAKAESGNRALADQLQPSQEPGPRLRGDERDIPPAAGQVSAAATPEALLGRMEQLLKQLLATEQAAAAKGEPSPKAARTLNILTQTMRTLAALRSGAPLPKAIENDDDDYDDMPADIDEFRRELARRIDAFVASRGDEFESQDDPDAA